MEAERRALFQKMLQSPSDLDVAFRYAALSSDAGDLEGAISTLERMLIYAPGLPRLQLELGVLYYRLSAYDVARTYFTAALQAPVVPDEVKDKVQAYLNAIDARTKDSQFSGTVTTGLRWQSNANAATSAISIQTTLASDPLLLNASARSDSDSNAFAAVHLRYSYDLGAQGDRLEGSLQAYAALQANHTELNTGFAELHIGPSFNLERFGIKDTRFSTYGILGGYLLDGDPYLGSIGVGAAVESQLDVSNRLGFVAEYRRETFHDSLRRPTASDRTGDDIEGSMTVQHMLSSDVTLFASLVGGRRLADVGYYSFNTYGANAGISVNFASLLKAGAYPWTLSLFAGYNRRNYDAPDRTFSLTDTQHDDEAFLQASLITPFNQDWALQTVIGYRNVHSNYDIYSYDNVSTSVGVVRKF